MSNMKNHSMLSKLRQQRRPIASMLAALIALWQVGQPILAADVNWNAGSGSNFNWFEGANWSAGIPGLADNAILPFTIPNPGVLANPGVIVLDSSSTVNLVSFSNNYSITGGSRTVGAGGLRADMGTGSIINSVVAGSAGLTKTGGGFIRLSNANTYTGVTTINNGSLIITHQNALGVDSSPVVVTSISPSGNGIVAGIGLRGFGGGSLVLDGTGGSIVFSRDLSLQGLGPISDRGAALISLGENTLSGTVTMGTPYNGTNIATRIIAANGTLNFTGTLNVLGTAATTLNNLGGIL